MRNRLLAYLVVLALLLSAVPCALAEDAQGIKSLPAVGDVVHGFEVTELSSIDLIGAPTVLFTHQKTGAQLLYIQADDVNRSFDITFETPALDNRGAPHVFEHAVLCGSEKYPYQNIVYSLMSQAYSTFVNASTHANFTTYPVASLSEEQLYVLADVYMDAVFNPAILKDERIYRREAWRYELADVEAPLQLNGTVYSEMKGAVTLNRTAHMNLRKALLPGSVLANESGGLPDYIPDLTHEQLIEFHEMYYHPSNARIILYGDLDYAHFLQNFDENYLSKYEKKEMNIESGHVEAFAEPVDVTYTFPVEANSPAENASYIYYGYLLDGISNKDLLGMELLANAINYESSPFMQAARAKMPGIEVYAGIAMDLPEPYLYFIAINVNESDKELFKSIADEAIAEIIEKGVDLEAMDSILASTRFSLLTVPEMQNLGVSLSMQLANTWINFDDVNYFQNYLSSLDAIESEIGLGYLEKLAEEYLKDNPHRALVTTVPVPGEAEKKAAELEAKLANVKAGMSAEELEALVAEGAAFTAWGAEEIPADLAAKIKVLTVDKLPEETDHHDISEETKDGIRYLKAETRVGEINMTSLLLDTAGFGLDDLHYLNLYTQLLGVLDTDQHTREQIETMIVRYLNGFSVGAGTYEAENEVHKPALSVSWMGLNGEYGANLQLVEEILYRTNFTDIEMIKSYVSRLKTSMQMTLTNSPYNMQLTRAFAVFDDDAAYNNYLSGLDLYKFYGEVEKLLSAEPETVTQKLEAVQQALKNKRNAIAIYTSNAEGLAEIDAELKTFFDALPDQAIEPADLSALPRPARREALVIDSAVQYNLIHASIDQLDLTFTGKYLPMSTCLTDLFFMPKLRYELGVYSIISLMDRSGFSYLAYRDPNVAETFDVFAQLPEFAKNLEMTQEDLDSYIISAYSSFAMPKGALSGASYALNQYLSGKTEEYLLNRMREIKSMTLDDIHALADAFAKLAETGAYSTAGGAAMIESNKDLYDSIIYVNKLLDSEEE